MRSDLDRLFDVLFGKTKTGLIWHVKWFSQAPGSGFIKNDLSSVSVRNGAGPACRRPAEIGQEQTFVAFVDFIRRQMYKMFERIKNLLQRDTPKSKSQIGSGGFVFITENESIAWQGVSGGDTVRNANTEPPWIVVNHSLGAVLVSRWPGRLFRVAILEKAKEQPFPYTNYTRAVAVLVVEELRACALLGERGAALAIILDRISTLTLAEAFALSIALQPLSREIYSTAWKNWLANTDRNSNYPDDNHEDTLQIRVGNDVSPVGYALSLISSKMLNQGRAVSGPAAIAIDVEGEAELQAPWNGATSALLYAAMAYGAPDLLTLQQAAVLKFPWETVIIAPTVPC